MGVVKLSKSGKQVQFITDSGEIYVTSTVLLGKVLNEHKPGNFIVLGRFPVGASPDRFPKSPVWTGTEVRPDDNRASQDGLSEKFRKSTKQEKQFQDKTVW